MNAVDLSHDSELSKRLRHGHRQFILVRVRPRVLRLEFGPSIPAKPEFSGLGNFVIGGFDLDGTRQTALLVRSHSIFDVESIHPINECRHAGTIDSESVEPDCRLTVGWPRLVPRWQCRKGDTGRKADDVIAQRNRWGRETIEPRAMSIDESPTPSLPPVAPFRHRTRSEPAAQTRQQWHACRRLS